MKKMKKIQEKSALEIIDEATHLLRGNALTLLPIYYIGSLPFIMGFLFFWGDMSRSAFAAEHCAAAALGLALLFAWMKIWQSLFMDRVRSLLSLMPHRPGTLKSLSRIAFVQSVIQPTGWVLLPLAMVFTIPFAWIFAFYQHLSLMDNTHPESLGEAVGRAVRQCRSWPKQNHVLFLILSAFGTVVFFNILIGLFALPYLLKTLFGFETIFTLTWRSFLNTTYLAVSMGLCYLCVDPLVKTVYTLRSFYDESIQTGEDLNVALRRLAAVRKTIPVVLSILLMVTFLCGHAAAEQTVDQPVAESVAAADLNVAIRTVLERPEFSWRLPRERNDHASRELFNPLAAFFKWVKPILKTAASPVIDILKPLAKKLVDWFRESARSAPPGKIKSSNINWIGWIKILLFLLLCVFGAMLGVYAKRVWAARKKRVQDNLEEDEPVVPDLNDENVDAKELNVDQWLSLANDLVAKGELRQGLRAVYLATLAYLAEIGVIQIARHKSNRDYATELRRRLHENKDAQDLFSANVTLFDRTWYGLYGVSRNDVELFTDNHKRIVNLVYGQ